MFMDDLDLEVLDLLENGFPRRRYKRKNYYEELDNKTFFQRFRLTKPTVLQLVEILEGTLEYPDNLNDPVSPVNQILTALRFYATGTHLSMIADYMVIHTSTASRIIKKVSNALASLGQQYIQMPQEDEMLEVQREFFNIASFPRVVGCIDGTHIKIQSPGGQDPEVYRNRKGYFSINVQIVGDACLRIRDVVARWPGSAHDATMFANSRIRARHENGEFPNTFLLGDSGYMLKPNFMTPLQDPRTREEHLYNESHIRTRNSIERLFGVLKRRFPVLALGIRLNIDTALSVIVACAVLHNMARAMNEPEPPPPEEIDEAHLNFLIEMGNIPDVPNNVPNLNHTRNALITNYFVNL